MGLKAYSYMFQNSALNTIISRCRMLCNCVCVCACSPTGTENDFSYRSDFLGDYISSCLRSNPAHAKHRHPPFVKSSENTQFITYIGELSGVKAP